MIDIANMTIAQIASLKSTVDAAHAALSGIRPPATPKPVAKLQRKPRVSAGSNSALSSSIVASLTDSEPKSSDALAAELDAPVGLVRKVLKSLIGAVVVETIGEKRGTKYKLCSATSSKPTSVADLG